MPIGTWRAHVSPTLGAPRAHDHGVREEASSARTQAVREIEAILRQRHRIADGAEAGLRRAQPGAVPARCRSASCGVLSVLLLSVAAVSLFVGGVGVMNIMLVTVTERRREIGIRMAVGAEPRDIQLQFLIEAVTLTAVGGGARARSSPGARGRRALRARVGHGARPRPRSLVAVGTSLVVGLVFGFLPARRAALVEPMEALRHE